jgi:hypothetical protein
MFLSLYDRFLTAMETMYHSQHLQLLAQQKTLKQCHISDKKYHFDFCIAKFSFSVCIDHFSF